LEIVETPGMSVATLGERLRADGELRPMLVGGVVLSLLFVALQVFGGGTPMSLAILALVALLLLMAGNPELVLAALMVVFYLDIHISIFSSAVWFTVLVAVAFVVHHRDFAWRDLLTPLSVPILVYGLSVIPSIFNADHPIYCIKRTYNMAAFLIAMYYCLMSIRTPDMLRRIIFLFIILTAADATDVIIDALNSRGRETGFAGVMFVDYAGISVSILGAMVFFAKGWKRIVLLALALLITMGLILTQTRNAWLATVITLGVGVGYLIRHPGMGSISRRRLIFTAVAGCIAIAAVALFTVELNPSVGTRAAGIVEANMVETSTELIIRNSLLTRVLIWTTALNAFLTHPLIGVGVFGFADVSFQYITVAKFLYFVYVKGNSPHIAYLAVLTETGIIGMAGFLYVLISMLRTSLRTIREIVDVSGRRYALVALVALVYCMVSMAFTDAWLWGQGVVLWGTVVGMQEAIARMFATSRTT
jgi:O-antigen ligase